MKERFLIVVLGVLLAIAAFVIGDVRTVLGASTASTAGPARSPSPDLLERTKDCPVTLSAIIDLVLILVVVVQLLLILALARELGRIQVRLGPWARARRPRARGSVRPPR